MKALRAAALFARGRVFAPGSAHQPNGHHSRRRETDQDAADPG